MSAFNPPTTTLDSVVGQKLGMHAEQAAVFRTEWEKSPQSVIIKAYLSTKLTDHIEERLRKLRGCTVEDLKKIQGELDGLDLALAVVTGRIVS